MKAERFNAAGWLRFLAQFDPIVEHSWVDEFSHLDDIELKKNDILLYTNMFQKPPYLALPQDDSPSPLAANLSTIYGASAKNVWAYINAYRNTLDKIIVPYIGIEGFEQLFSSYYFQFEWMMHIEPDFIKEQGSLYRDHFLHQTKNAWMGYVYLRSFNWMQYVVDWLEENQTNTIVESVNRAIKDETLYRLKQDSSDIKHPVQSIVEIYRNALLKRNNTDITNELERCLRIRDESFAHAAPEEQRYTILSGLVRMELIQTTWFIASLLHDIGYPVQYIRSQAKQIEKYLPSMDWPHIDGEHSYDHLQKLLRNSLLFKVVQERDLRYAYLNGAHGTVSALVMLNHFYQQSTVHSFSPLKQCAVDWAAVCIQQHTQNFQASQNDKKQRYLVDQFENNALGYLLRLVDDLQEYDRFYFDVSRSHSLLLCKVCNQPMEHRDDDLDKGETAYKDMLFALDEAQPLPPKEIYTELKPHAYECFCVPEDGSEGHFPVEQYRTFDYRKINTLLVCREVDVEVEEESGITKQLVTMQYNDWAMLMMLSINPSFLTRRIYEANIIKRMLKNQSKLPGQFIDLFVSVNPLWLKANILYRFLEAKGALPSRATTVQNYLNDLNRCMLELDRLIESCYLNGSQCLGCASFVTCQARKVVGDKRNERTSIQKRKYAALKKAYNDKGQPCLPKKRSRRCPAAENAYRVYWRFVRVYLPMLAGYLMVKSSNDEPGIGAPCFERGSAFDQWYLDMVDKIAALGDGSVNAYVVAFMMDFRECCASLWYHLREKKMPNTYYGALYYRQYEFIANQKRYWIDADNASGGSHSSAAVQAEKYKWRETYFKADETTLEQSMREDMLRNVSLYVSNRNYHPRKYLQRDSQNKPLPEWSEIDFFSDLKAMHTAHTVYMEYFEKKQRDRQSKQKGAKAGE